MHDLATTTAVRILRRMEELNAKEYVWSTRLLGRVEANVLLAMGNGIEFTPALIKALAEGKENTPEINAFREVTPIHYGLLNGTLDAIYESYQPKGKEMSNLYICGKAFEDNPACLIRVDGLQRDGAMWYGAIIYPPEHATHTEGSFNEHHNEFIVADGDEAATTVYLSRSE